MSAAAVEYTIQISFETLIAPVLTPAYRLAAGLTRNREDAEDLVHEAVLRAHRAFDSFETGTNFKAWFFRILINCFRTQYRRKRTHTETVAFDDGLERALMANGSASWGERFAEAPDALRQLHADEITAALRTLPEEYRAVATMYFVDDLSYQEMAEALDIPVGTVRSRLHRGRKMLQARLWALAVDLGIVSPSDATAEREAHSGG
jgi:RNA polymerase sigma-70 factor (ECF subfamily)